MPATIVCKSIEMVSALSVAQDTMSVQLQLCENSLVPKLCLVQLHGAKLSRASGGACTVATVAAVEAGADEEYREKARANTLAAGDTLAWLCVIQIPLLEPSEFASTDN